jgi:CRP/FNR family cyclic AMP-dependent transcriptional regulator
MTRQELLANIPLFESLTPEDLDGLTLRLEESHYEPGEVIFRQGDDGSSLYIIEEGAVDIAFGEGSGNIVLATLFNGPPRSATATATKHTHVIRLDRDDLVEFVHKNPAASLRIIEEMGDRLRQTNELMSRQVSRNVLEEQEETLTFGQRIADRVAAFGGSWPFIIMFSTIMIVWMTINVVSAVARFDPYPFILLNLALSSVAALQAPIIMMSQNRQSTKDKLLAENDYQVNLKAEMEIAALLRGQSEMLARLAVVERALGRRGESQNGTS